MTAGTNTLLVVLATALLGLTWPAIRADVNVDDRAPIQAVEKFFVALEHRDLQGLLDLCAYPFLVREIYEQPSDKVHETVYETRDKAEAAWSKEIKALNEKVFELSGEKLLCRVGTVAVVMATIETDRQEVGPCLFVVVALRDGWRLKEIMMPM